MYRKTNNFFSNSASVISRKKISLILVNGFLGDKFAKELSFFWDDTENNWIPYILAC